MSFQNCLAFSLGLLALFIADSASAQNKLDDAKTFADVAAYLSQEIGRHNPDAHAEKENARILGGVLLAAGDKLLAIAQNDMETRSAYNMKLTALQNQAAAGIEGADKQLDALFDEIASHDNPDIRNFAAAFRFNQFRVKVLTTVASPENFEQLTAELKILINRKGNTASDIAAIASSIAERNGVPTGQFTKGLIAYVQSPECRLPTEEKERVAGSLEAVLRLAPGQDPKLYGKTLDDKDFDWEKLRGKYVLVKFTATWCGPCQMKIPGMLEAYEQYHDKGLEIVSVYIWERGDDPVTTVKNYVESKQLPWIIISEELSKRAKHPAFGEFYNISGVPTFVLADKKGEIIVPATHGEEWKAKLAEIFE